MWKLSPLTMFTIARPCKSFSFSLCGMMKYPVQSRPCSFLGNGTVITVNGRRSGQLSSIPDRRLFILSHGRSRATRADDLSSTRFHVSTAVPTPIGPGERKELRIGHRFTSQKRVEGLNRCHYAPTPHFSLAGFFPRM